MDWMCVNNCLAQGNTQQVCEQSCAYNNNSNSNPFQSNLRGVPGSGIATLQDMAKQQYAYPEAQQKLAGEQAQTAETQARTRYLRAEAESLRLQNELLRKQLEIQNQRQYTPAPQQQQSPLNQSSLQEYLDQVKNIQATESPEMRRAVVEDFLRRNTWFATKDRAGKGNMEATAYAVQLENDLTPALGVTMTSKIMFVEIERRVFVKFPELKQQRGQDNTPTLPAQNNPSPEPFAIAGDASRGANLFYGSARCKTCHRIDADKLVGPGLAGVKDRHSEAWLKQWIANPQAVWTANNAEVQELKWRVGKSSKPKTAMAPARLTDGEIDDIIAFLQTL